MAALNKGFQWEGFTGQTLPRGRLSVPALVHPVVRLLKLPNAATLDKRAVCNVIEACISGGAHCNAAVQEALHLPAAAWLSPAHIEQLINACKQHKKFVVMQTILEATGGWHQWLTMKSNMVKH